MSAVSRFSVLCLVILALGSGCSSESPTPPERVAQPTGDRPSILLVTLDTTRADRLDLAENRGATPELSALAARGLLFSQAYSTVPTTLPSHTSMLTGLYPADHGIRENGRRVSDRLVLLASRLKERGYETAAFVSGFPLASQFGLARGFSHFDDDFGADRAERTAGETTDQALAFLKQQSAGPLFFWVHYFDPHEPYEAPEPFASRFADDPYLGEIAYMDQEVGRLVTGFEERLQPHPWKILVVGDHGEGLGDHGEALHGNLLYQGVMRVPLIVAGTHVEPETVERAVSVRQVFATVLTWAGLDGQGSLLEDTGEPVLAESLKPYLQYGWQPQYMAVRNGVKVIRSGVTEVYDVLQDPEETRDLVGQIDLDPLLGESLTRYATRALAEVDVGDQDPGQQARDKLASLGYFSSGGRPTLREDAPNPKDMVHLYRDLDVGAGLFIRQDYARAIPVFARVAESDPNNFVVALRLAVAHSVTGNEAAARQYFERAKAIDSSSIDLRHYQAMHYLQYRQWDLAQPLFESVLAQTPERLPALEGLAQIYTRQRRLEDAARLMETIVQIKDSPGLELARLGELRMALGDTAGAIRAFEKSQEALGDLFTYNLELGVLYLADRRLAEAAANLDKVSTTHPGYPMALFKRAQVGVLLDEPDREARVRAAWTHADETTRSLIEGEQLFRDITFR